MTVKRAVDAAGATLLLIGLAPLEAAIAIAIRARMGRPILFSQKRPGRHETPFTLLKFRTMTDDHGPDGAPLPDGQRLTPLGRFLRSTSLDELPQLLNILAGDMSFIGPRPLLTRYAPYFTARERLRFSVRPGVTGLAQVTGRNQLGWDQRLALDVWYVEHWSLWLDLRVALATLGVIATRRGLQVDPGAEMLNLDEERGLHSPSHVS